MSRKYAEDTDRTARIKFAVVGKTIVPGDNTQEDMKTKAQDFMADNRNLENLIKSAAEQGLNVETSIPLEVGKIYYMRGRWNQKFGREYALEQSTDLFFESEICGDLLTLQKWLEGRGACQTNRFLQWIYS